MIGRRTDFGTFPAFSTGPLAVTRPHTNRIEPRENLTIPTFNKGNMTKLPLLTECLFHYDNGSELFLTALC